MAFLIKEELKTVADLNIVDIITDLDDTIISQIVDESIAIMKSYLAKYYDCDLIFSATGAQRNQAILKRLKDIVIFEIYIRHTREFNEVAKWRYDEVIAWLEKINTGTFVEEQLPPNGGGSGGSGSGGSIGGQDGLDIRFGNGHKYESSF